MSDSSTILIEKNSIHYDDNMVKISNISRTYIVKFYNQKRKKFEDEMRKYENSKRMYEIIEKNKRTSRVRNCIITAVLLFIVSIFILQSIKQIGPDLSGFVSLGVTLLIAAILCGIIAFLIAHKSIVYPDSPPEETPCPDTHGLFIEVNSGRSVVFTAVDNEGKESLRILQRQINEADQLLEPTMFNMIENHISVENNDGIISLGENAENTVHQKEVSDI